jgi:hypothetical protein
VKKMLKRLATRKMASICPHPPPNSQKCPL